jgi:predicted RNA polymerase sigma factor
VLRANVDGARARATAEAVARSSYGKLIAYLAHDTREVAAAEDALAEAFAVALTDWPRSGCPANPEGWLLTVARRKAIDALRRRQTAATAAPQLKLLAELRDDDADVPDHRLGLLFACAHPAIDAAVHAPLMLQVVLGLSADAIAAAYLVSPAAMAKRLGRAKQKIRAAGIALRVPDRDELAPRLEAVLEAVYGAFGEGWHDALTPTDALTDEALFLAGLIAELLPEEPEALGLHALLLYAQSRRAARRSPAGDYVPLANQDRRLWDRSMLAAAEALLTRAHRCGRIGRYQLEAAVQSAHVYRLSSGESNWADVVQLYDALLALSASPVVAINRALALGELHGAAAGLAALDAVAGDARLVSYQPYWAARAEQLARAGRSDDASDAYERAIALATDASVHRYLRKRQGDGSGASREPLWQREISPTWPPTPSTP